MTKATNIVWKFKLCPNKKLGFYTLTCYLTCTFSQLTKYDASWLEELHRILIAMHRSIGKSAAGKFAPYARIVNAKRLRNVNSNPGIVIVVDIFMLC